MIRKKSSVSFPPPSSLLSRILPPPSRAQRSLFSIHLFVTCVSIISYISERTVVIIKDKKRKREKKRLYPSHIAHFFFFLLLLFSFVLYVLWEILSSLFLSLSRIYTHHLFIIMQQFSEKREKPTAEIRAKSERGSFIYSDSSLLSFFHMYKIILLLEREYKLRMTQQQQQQQWGLGSRSWNQRVEREREELKL